MGTIAQQRHWAPAVTRNGVRFFRMFGDWRGKRPIAFGR